MADNTRERSLKTETHEVKTDGRAVSVRLLSTGEEQARFSEDGSVIDGVLLNHQPIQLAAWTEFREELKRFYGIDVPQNYAPLWLLKRQFATTVI